MIVLYKFASRLLLCNFWPWFAVQIPRIVLRCTMRSCVVRFTNVHYLSLRYYSKVELPYYSALQNCRHPNRVLRIGGDQMCISASMPAFFR